MSDAKIVKVLGRAVSVEGNDIDTDRIIPARYLKEITFTNMGSYPFYDERFESNGKLKPHPFNEPQFAGSSILFVNKNFGCGSSREHAPQSLMRWGIKAVVGESFAEIFAGNCAMLGIPTVTAPASDLHTLIQAAKNQPKTAFTLDLEALAISAPSFPAVKVSMPETMRQSFLHGTWDTTSLLLDNMPKTKQTMARLPYLNDFK